MPHKLSWGCCLALIASALTPCALVSAAPTPAPLPVLHWQPLDEPGSGGAMTAMRISPHDPKRMLVAGDMLGLGLSADGGKTWEATTGFTTWEMADVTWSPTDPMTVWAGSVSGPYVSHDGGKRWQPERTGMPPPAGFGNSAPIERVLFDPNDPTHLLAVGCSSRRWDVKSGAAMGALWDSRDAGLHWTRRATLTADGVSTDPNAQGVNIVSADFAAHSSQVLYAALDGHGIQVSSDGGTTWQARNDGLPSLNVERVIAHPADPNVVFCSLDNAVQPDKTVMPGGIYKSVDQGRHWTPICTGLRQGTGTDPNLTARYKAFTVSPSNPDVMYASDSAWDGGVSYVTMDGGAHWRAAVTKGNFGVQDAASHQGVFNLQNSQPAGLGMGVFTGDPKNPDVAYGLSTDTIIGTRDGGKTWFDALCYHPATASDAWRGRGYTGWCTTSFRFDPYAPGVSVFQAMDAARVWVSRDNLTSWTRALDDPAPWNGGVDAAFTRDGHIYVTTGTFNFNGIGRSTDGGKTWTVLAGKAHGLPEFYQNPAPHGIYALPDEPQTAWVTLGDSVYETQDGGDHWAPVFTSRSLTWIAADPRRPHRFYVAGAKNVYVTDDGCNFVPIGGPHNDNTHLTVDSRGRLLAAAKGGDRPGLWRYDPATKTWTRLWSDGLTSGVAVDPTHPNRLALTTQQDPYLDVCQSSGVWLSSDGGQTWKQENDGLAMTRGSVIAFNPSNPAQLVWGSEGRGFWTCRWPETLALSGGAHYASTSDDARFAAVQGWE